MLSNLLLEHFFFERVLCFCSLSEEGPLVSLHGYVQGYPYNSTRYPSTVGRFEQLHCVFQHDLPSYYRPVSTFSKHEIKMKLLRAIQHLGTMILQTQDTGMPPNEALVNVTSTSLLSYTRVIPPPTFDHFLALPIELQLQIWTHAFGTLKLSCLELAFLHYSFPYLVPDLDCFTSEQALVIFTRRSLLSVCRLSRLNTLKLWRRELASVPVASELWDDFGRRKKERALDTLDVLIDELTKAMSI